MKSGGFGLGKSQVRREQPKRSHPPTSTDLTQLLQASQKAPDKPFSLTWQPSEMSPAYTVHVINYGAQKDRRGWTTSAIDNSALGEAEWRLTEDFENHKTEIFAMKSSDALLIQTLMEETLMANSGGGTSSKVDLSSLDLGPGTGTSGDDQERASLFGQQEQAPAPPAPEPTPASPFDEGNLRKTSIKSILENFYNNKTTGRLVCDMGTMTAEVFLMNGEPVHAKSCHSIYQDRDMTGDTVLIDMLTWKDGSFKFQKDWPAASKSITQPMEKFLSGEAVAQAPEAPAAPAAASAPASASAKLESHSAPPAATSGLLSNERVSSVSNPEDFNHIEDAIAEMYSELIEPSGFLKYGMFLMLANSEFVRHDSLKSPFCIAAIGMELSQEHATNYVLRKIGECFESVCQPLDIIAFASTNRLYALFPQTPAVSAEKTLRYFINNVSTTQLDTKLHGSSMKLSIGVAEVPRGGSDLQTLLQQACELRREATADRILVAKSF